MMSQQEENLLCQVIVSHNFHEIQKRALESKSNTKRVEKIDSFSL